MVNKELKNITTIAQIAPILNVSVKTVYGYIDRYDFGDAVKVSAVGRGSKVEIVNVKKFIKVACPAKYKELYNAKSL